MAKTDNINKNDQGSCPTQTKKKLIIMTFNNYKIKLTLTLLESYEY